MNITPDLVRHILQHRDQFQWSLQGFGMLRTYIGEDLRLHIWSNQHQVDDVSLMHTHPWDFSSLIVSGKITNHLYSEVPSGTARFADRAMWRQRILCGEGGGLEGEPEEVWLRPVSVIQYPANFVYRQAANEIHFSEFDDGTVTVIRRSPAADPDHAAVYWEAGKQWVSAEPRPATTEEVDAIVGLALERWTA
jgi:hypothetical protein